MRPHDVLRPRIVSRAGDLDALPVGSIIAVDSYVAWTRHDDGWLLAGNGCIWQSVRAIRPEGPFRVLRVGWGV